MIIPPTATLQTSGSGYRQPIMESATGMYLHFLCLCGSFIKSTFHNQRLCIIGQTCRWSMLLPRAAM
jgi:hypothetical protein